MYARHTVLGITGKQYRRNSLYPALTEFIIWRGEYSFKKNTDVIAKRENKARREIQRVCVVICVRRATLDMAAREYLTKNVTFE